MASWTVKDTLQWLEVLRLSQYQERFAKNEISGELQIRSMALNLSDRLIHPDPSIYVITGPILLEIGLEDLDYMEITVLAHRKVG